MAEMNHSDPSAPRGDPRQGGGREAPQAKKRKKKRRRLPLVLTILLRTLQVIVTFAGTLILIGVITGTFMISYAAIYVKTVVMP